MIREVNAVDYLDAIAGLAADNWGETGFDFDMKLDRELYRRLQDSGRLISLAAFDGDDVIGYATATVAPHIFNTDVHVCMSSALFVAKNKRSSTVPGRLILETERIAKKRGARFMIWQTRAGTGLADTLRKRGYSDSDVAVIKEI
jgi:predicted GNAT superfamily acetyltransferase